MNVRLNHVDDALYCGREMRIGLDVAQHQLLWPELVERVQFAEFAGFDGVWVFDHFKPLYGDPNGPCMEAWTLLARARECGVGNPLPSHQGAGRAAGRRRAGDEAADDEGSGHLYRPALPAR